MMRVLFFTSLFSLLLALPAKGQRSHTDVYKALIQALANQTPDSVRAIEGDTLTGFLPELALQAGAPALILEAPEFRYARLPDGRFVRTVVLAYSLRDSASSRGATVEVQDTANLAAFRRCRREAIPFLKGDPITEFGKLLRPALIVAGSIGGILVLFRLRSQ